MIDIIKIAIGSFVGFGLVKVLDYVASYILVSYAQRKADKVMRDLEDALRLARDEAKEESNNRTTTDDAN